MSHPGRASTRRLRSLLAALVGAACLPLPGCTSGDGNPFAPPSGTNPSGWFVQTRPTVYPLLGVAAIDRDRVAVVGVGGFVARKARGDDWQVQDSGITATLRDVAFAGPNVGIAVGDGGTVVRTVDGGAYWQSVDVGTAATLRSVAVSPSGAAVAVGDGGTIVTTGNDGVTWTARRQDVRMSFRDVRFVTRDSVLVCGRTAGQDSTDILLSTDQGATWSELCCGGEFHAVEVMSDKYDLGGLPSMEVWGDGSVLASRDGGVTWDAAVGDRLEGAYVFGWRDAVWCRSLPGEILYGDYLFPQVAETDARTILYPAAIDFADDRTGWLVGGKGLVLRSDDHGHTWQHECEPGPADLLGLFFLDVYRGWAGGKGAAIYRTTDGGVRWDRQIAGAGSEAYEALCFLDPTRGFAVSRTGTQTFVETFDGGSRWTPVPSVPVRGYTDVTFVDGMVGYACGTGVLLKTVNGGADWVQLDDGRTDTPPYQTIRFADADHGFVATTAPPSFMRTTDGGATWETRETILDASHWWSMDFRSPAEGWLAGGADNASAAVVLHTTDAGESWTEQYRSPDLETHQMYGIDFADDANGWAVGGSVYDLIVRTTNGGITWNEQAGVNDAGLRALRDVRAFDSRRATAVGHWGVVLRTETGGELR